VVRSANAGTAMIIDPRGRTTRATAPLGEGVIVDTVQTTDGTTLYVRWGDWIGGLAAVLSIMVMTMALTRRAGVRVSTVPRVL
jgi:apolipoprotein N-acyltransferase